MRIEKLIIVPLNLYHLEYNKYNNINGMFLDEEVSHFLAHS